MNQELSIAIPTYKRSDILIDTLPILIKQAKKYSISIYIFDNSPDNLTEILIDRLKIDHNQLYFIPNKKYLGHDLNILRALSDPKTNYTWLLGDGLIVEEGIINKILDIINDIKPKIIGINSVGRNIDEDEGIYNNENAVFNKFCWHQSLTGSTVYNKHSLKLINHLSFEKSDNFPHINIIFNSLLNDCNYYWIKKEYMRGHPKKDSYWKDDVFEVFIDDWKQVIFQLPDKYNIKNKEEVIRMHCKKSGLFNLSSLFILRAKKYYNLKKYKKYKNDFRKYIKINNSILFIIAIIPVNLNKLIMTMVNFLKK